MITTAEVAEMIADARGRCEAGFPAGHLRLEQWGIDVRILRPSDDGRTTAYVADSIVMDEHEPDERHAIVDVVVRCAERLHRRRNAVMEWNLANGRHGDAIAPWAVWVHEAVKVVLDHAGNDAAQVMTTKGNSYVNEVAAMGEVPIGDEGLGYIYDAGWAGVGLIIPRTTLPASIVQALPGRTIGETIAHPALPSDMLIRNARINDGDLRIGLEPRYAPLAPPPTDADLSWMDIGVAPWRRTDFVARPVET